MRSLSSPASGQLPATRHPTSACSRTTEEDQPGRAEARAALDVEAGADVGCGSRGGASGRQRGSAQWWVGAGAGSMAAWGKQGEREAEGEHEQWWAGAGAGNAAAGAGAGRSVGQAGARGSRSVAGQQPIPGDATRYRIFTGVQTTTAGSSGASPVRSGTLLCSALLDSGAIGFTRTASCFGSLLAEIFRRARHKAHNQCLDKSLESDPLPCSALFNHDVRLIRFWMATVVGLNCRADG
ncbi:hypothetical protein B0H14DRAFT_2581240 [Mycena olivaceomarginata]|nr:hypothetical protein B0H14DRAFT_2581240 [Mycena olivaceomarginata]